jgi:hypothetical protein
MANFLKRASKAVGGGLLGGLVGGGLGGVVGSVAGGVGGLFGGLGNPLDSPEPPPAPDYGGAAAQQGRENRATALFNAKLSNPFFSNPYGTQRIDWSGQRTGDAAIPFVDTELTPLGQQAWDSQQRLSAAMGTAAEGSLGRVNEAFAGPFEFDSNNALQQAAQDSIMSRLTPLMDRQEAQLRTQLANQGLAPGGEAYSNAMTDFNNARNDAQMQAVLQGIRLQPQLLSQALTMRNQPLNEFNALRTGAQVQAPQFQGFQGASAAAAPIYQANADAAGFATDIYNQQMGARNALLSGLFSLGGAGLQGAMMRPV